MKSIKNAVNYFWQYLKEYKLKLFLVFIAAIASSYFVVKSPEFSGQAINELGAYIMSMLKTGTGDKTAFYGVIRMMAIFAVSSMVLSVIQNMLMSNVSGHATNEMREDLFKKLEKLPIRYFDKTSDGDILARFTSDLDNISNTLNQSIHQIISNVIMFIITLILMFSNHVELSLVVLSTSPILIIFSIVIIGKAQKYVEIQQKKLGALNGFADERFTGQKLVIANGLQDESKAAFETYNQDLYEATYRGQLYSNLLFPALQGLSMFTTGIVIFYGAWMTLNGRLPLAEAAGTIFLFSQYVRMVYQPLSQIASQYTQMQLAFTGADRIMEILQEEEEVDRSGVIDIDGITGDVVLDKVNFAYDEELVLKDVSLKVEHGTMVALVGHTGSGKTTIMNLLNRFYNVEDGTIYFDGNDIRDISLPTLRSNVGIVLQDSVLFSGTIRDNINFGRNDATQEEIEEAAKKAYIHEFIMSLDKGYDTEVSDGNSGMSVGQKQLISIARTILVDPDLLILDEATSNVDTVTEHQIQLAMDEVVKGRTSFVIAHRLKTILDADKIIVLQQGEIIEEGTHDELVEAGNTYAELYENQFVFE